MKLIAVLGDKKSISLNGSTFQKSIAQDNAKYSFSWIFFFLAILAMLKLNYVHKNLEIIQRNAFITSFIIYLRHLSVAKAILWPVETNICFAYNFEMN